MTTPDQATTTLRGITPAELSKLLFGVRESLEMWADLVERKTGKHDAWTRRLVAEVEALRTAQGWSPNGFGGEGGDDAA